MKPRSPTSYASSARPRRRPGGRKSRATKAGASRSTPSASASRRCTTASGDDMSSAFHAGDRDPLDELALEDDEDDDHRQRRDDRSREQQRPRRLVLHDEQRKAERHRVMPGIVDDDQRPE